MGGGRVDHASMGSRLGGVGGEVWEGGVERTEGRERSDSGEGVSFSLGSGSGRVVPSPKRNLLTLCSLISSMDTPPRFSVISAVVFPVCGSFSMPKRWRDKT